jgi:hypothetical protein
VTPFPANMRSLSIVRTGDGLYQANLQTDEHQSNAYSVAIAASPADALAELFGRGTVILPPCPLPLPPY